MNEVNYTCSECIYLLDGISRCFYKFTVYKTVTLNTLLFSDPRIVNPGRIVRGSDVTIAQCPAVVVRIS